MRNERSGRAPAVEVKRAGGRTYERLDWLHAWHSFSGAEYRQGTDSHFGVLVNHDHVTVSAGTGFDTHYHRNMEIVTWVLDGSLVHQDTRGHAGLIHPGLAQRMTAGAGILHSERNDSWRLDGARHQRDVELVQMWVVPDAAGVVPSYEQHGISTELDAGGLVLVASGLGRHADDSAIRIRNRFAAMHAARLGGGGGGGRPRRGGRREPQRRGRTPGDGQDGVRGAGLGDAHDPARSLKPAPLRTPPRSSPHASSQPREASSSRAAAATSSQTSGERAARILPGLVLVEVKGSPSRKATRPPNSVSRRMPGQWSQG